MRISYFFFFNDTATTEISPLPQPDALPIEADRLLVVVHDADLTRRATLVDTPDLDGDQPLHHRARLDAEDELRRSEEHTSELQSRQYLVCRLLLEKKKNKACRIVTSHF